MISMTTSEISTLITDNQDFIKSFNTLQDGNLLLFATDALWSVGCDMSQEKGLNRLIQLLPNHAPYSFEILTNSADMIKEYVQHLHPRLETLLLYHSRPLTLVIENTVNVPPSILHEDGTAAFRVVTDVFCSMLIEKLGKPIISVFAPGRDHPFSQNFGSISSDLIEQVDYVSKNNQHKKFAGLPPVMVQLTNEEELDFIRE